MSEMEDLKRRLGLDRQSYKARPQEDAEEQDAPDPKLVALTEYDAALKELVALEERLQASQKRFQEATRKLQLALLGKSE